MFGFLVAGLGSIRVNRHNHHQAGTGRPWPDVSLCRARLAYVSYRRLTRGIKSEFVDLDDGRFDHDDFCQGFNNLHSNGHHKRADNYYIARAGGERRSECD